MQKIPATFQRIAGFTLLELLIAAAIGSFLLAGVFKVYVNGRHTQSLVEVQTQMIDDGRFALRSLGYDLRHAGLWGKTNDHTKIQHAIGNADSPFDAPTPPALPGGCDGADWYRNFRQSFFVQNNSNPYATSCIPNGDYRANTDVLVVKYASPIAIDEADLGAGVIYVYANNFEGAIFSGQTQPSYKKDADDAPENFALRSRAYFVNEFTDVTGDGYPSLHRIGLSAGPSVSNSMLIPGVEDFQIQLGLDTNRDGSVNMYVDADNALVGPEMAEVKSVQFWVMLRSRGIEFEADESQSLSMAGRSAVNYSDGYRRVIVSNVVKLQNRHTMSRRAGG